MQTGPKGFFDSLNWATVVRFKDDKRPEDSILDYISFKGYGKDPKFVGENIAKPLSGLANGNGGVVLYGVAAGDKKVGGRDIPGGFDGLLPDGLDQAVGDVVTTKVSPPIDGVVTRVIESKAGKQQVLAIYVPQSAEGPHQCTHDLRYYRRFDDDTRPLDHAAVELLFRAKHGKEMNLFPVLAIFKTHKIDDKTFNIEMINMGNTLGLNLKAYCEDVKLSEMAVLGAPGTGPWRVYCDYQRPCGEPWKLLYGRLRNRERLDLRIEYSDFSGARYAAFWRIIPSRHRPEEFALAEEVSITRNGMAVT